MLCADFMPRSYDATLEKREGTFHCVCVNVARHIVLGVADRAMLFLLNLIQCPWVDLGFIRHNHFHGSADVRLDDFADGLGLRIFGVNQSKVTVALTNTDNNLFVAPSTPTAFLAADISLVNLNRAVEL